ncbi:MAG: signal transduction histidine kinase, partial [Planctomycetota bacterium]
MKIRRISTKLVLAVLAAVVLPFGGFALYVDQYVSWRSLEAVKQAVLSLVTDVTRAVDEQLDDQRRQMELWTAEPRTERALAEAGDESLGVAEHLLIARANPSNSGSLLEQQVLAFDRYMASQSAFDLLLLVDSAGKLVVSNSRASDGSELPEELLQRIIDWDYSTEDWFAEALESGRAQVDQHRSPLLESPNPQLSVNSQGAFHVGLARRVGEGQGVVFGLINWKVFSDLLQAPLMRDYFRGMVPEDVVPSPYAWIWGADADTILAHQDPGLIGVRVSGERIGLTTMVEDARSGVPGQAGLFREYEFNGVHKNAAFKQCALPADGGFGWYVGVGINNDDIYAATTELSEVLYKGTAVVLLAGVLWMMIIARRTTVPIRELQLHTQRVADGDLDARIQIDSADELGDLADAFNRMTHDLSENRTALVKAEKDAAWREMARQIAHDIKNPLTPIKLSLDLLRRAKADQRGDFESILERTMGLMERQVQNLREIATDFYEFTGGRKPRPEVLSVPALVNEVTLLHQAWAESRGIELTSNLGDELVWADAGKLRRVLTNLISNAFQAMTEGGKLEIKSSTIAGVGELPARVRIEFIDTGSGLTPDVIERLFEPYFTTRSEGTGLG